MIITIDGPAGAGKSTVARALARRLGFAYLDTGAMYRAVALAGLRRGVDWSRPEELARLAEQLKIEVAGERIYLEGEDVTEAVRSAEVTAMTRFAADNPQVRQRLVRLQRRAAEGRDLVTEGRDQGSLVFPEADCKVFLTASPEERARRRMRDLEAQGEYEPFTVVLEKIVRRDTEDASRAVGPLVEPAGAIRLSTDGLTVDEVVERLAAAVQERRAQRESRGEIPDSKPQIPSQSQERKFP
jgi:cytidylate kinase